MRSAVNIPWPASNRWSSTRLTGAPTFFGRSPRPTLAPVWPNTRSRPSVTEVGLFLHRVPSHIVDPDDRMPTHPAQRLRHGVRRPYPARDVDASARSFVRLYLARPLGAPGTHAGARPVRRTFSRRR